MKRNRLWIEIFAIISVSACAVALLIATLGTVAVAVGGQPAVGQETESPAKILPAAQPGDVTQAFEGMVTCSTCGAKHPARLDQNASDCARRCVHTGATFTLVDGDKTYQLQGNLGLLKKVAGERARIVGVVRGHTITVSSVSAA